VGKKRLIIMGEETPSEKKKSKKPERLHSGKAEEARLADMGQKALEELEQIQKKEQKLEKETAKEIISKTENKKSKTIRTRSKRYQNIKKAINQSQKYSINEALEIIENNKLKSFDESVEIHLVTNDKLSGSVSLPNLTGKKQRVAIADDKLIESITKGKIDFDILVAAPEMMPKLAKVASILGPKGLMPNPKTGTISDKPEEVKKKLEAGLIRFKTEPKANLIHFTIGKVSLGKEKLAENFEAFINAVKPKNILRASISSTMGPGIKLAIDH
jgi:large subunit ribosomal protein L1